MMSQQGNFTGNEADMTYKEIRKNKEINAYIKKGNDNLGVLGYTDHSQVHCTLVAERAAMILEKFGCTEHDIELVKIAGYMHDIGNSINRKNHAEYGALLANELLQRTDMSLEDRVTVVSAIANHDESTGGAVDIISAALIIADKTDVRRDRVREKDKAQYDTHDRVNYAVEASALKISTEKKQIALNLQIDESICTMYDYFDIFLGRMQMCRHAAEFFDARFKLTANGSKVL
jgi:metal-dependent HD superfamily phosphatase/phosphodiesterase